MMSTFQHIFIFCAVILPQTHTFHHLLHLAPSSSSEYVRFFNNNDLRLMQSQFLDVSCSSVYTCLTPFIFFASLFDLDGIHTFPVEFSNKPWKLQTQKQAGIVTDIWRLF